MFPRTARFPSDPVVANLFDIEDLTPVGSTFESAAQISRAMWSVTNLLTSSDNLGIRLPAAVPGMFKFIINRAQRSYRCYAASGETFNGAAVNNTLQVPGSGSGELGFVLLFCRTPKTWEATALPVFTGFGSTGSTLSFGNLNFNGVGSLGASTVNTSNFSCSGQTYLASNNAITATGATQGTAADSLTFTFHRIAAGAADTGVIFRNLGAGVCSWILNDTTTDKLIYPPSGGTIVGHTLNAPVRIRAGELMFFWMSVAGGLRYHLLSGGAVRPKTAAYTVLIQESEFTFTDEGAVADQDFTLPPSAPVGAISEYVKVANTANRLRIIAPAGETIDTPTLSSSPGGHFQTVVRFSSVVLRKVTSTNWVPMGSQLGTWTAA